MKEGSKSFLPIHESRELNESLKSVEKNENSILYKTEGLNNQKDKKIIRQIIHYLKKHNKSITSDYESWYRVAYGIANTFSYDVGLKFYLELCRLDGPSHDEYKSIEMLKYCYYNKRPRAIMLGTIIHFAIDQGYKHG